MLSASRALLVLAGIAALSGCDPDARLSEKGFRLPDGNAAAGRAAFIYMQCHACHTVAGEQLPEIPGEAPPYVELGGKVSRVKTYGELVTAIINPSHRLARGYAADVVAEGHESKMYVYNSYMTIQELIDIVTYLQPKYDVRIPAYHYRVYPVT